MRAVLLFGFLVILGAASPSSGEEDTFLGFRLGCSKAEWKAVMDSTWRGAVKVNSDQLQYTDCGEEVFYDGNSSLTGTEMTHFTFWSDSLASVVVFYTFKDSDSADETAETLVRMAERRYGQPMKRELGRQSEQWLMLFRPEMMIVVSRIADYPTNGVVVGAFDPRRDKMVSDCKDRHRERSMGKF